MMVVIIDNYDSFTHNLSLYFRELGQDVVVVKNDSVTVSDVESMQPQHVVISPGPCTPNESGVSMPVIKALGGSLPLLGVCLGHQAIAQQFGASIVHASTIMHGKVCTIDSLDSGVLFRGCAPRFNVTRYHSLTIKPDTLPDNFNVTAWCHEAGQRTIMAIEDKCRRTYGVQFHPESLLTDFGHKILENFLIHG